MRWPSCSSSWALLEASFGEVKVIYTRDSDVFVELNERAKHCQPQQCRFCLFACIAMRCRVLHAWRMLHYVLVCTKQSTILAVAMRENASIYLKTTTRTNYQALRTPTVPKRVIFGSTCKSAYLEQSILLAQYVQQFATSEVPYDRGVVPRLDLSRGRKRLRLLCRPKRGIRQTPQKMSTLPPMKDSGTNEASGHFQVHSGVQNFAEKGESSVAATKNALVKPVAQKTPADFKKWLLPSKKNRQQPKNQQQRPSRGPKPFKFSRYHGPPTRPQCGANEPAQ